MKEWLLQLEEQRKIKILYACEAGSRAWGMDTKDSDHDIRFIYIHRELKSYLTIDEPESVIEVATPFDAVGWDIRKALKLIRKSNPSIFEWAYSPIVYLEKDLFLMDLRAVINEAYSPKSLALHYFHLMSRNIKEIAAKNDFTSKEQKKLIQALRAFLAVKILLLRKKITAEVLIKVTISNEVDEFWRINYQELITAKKTNCLIATNQAKAIITTLEKSKYHLGNEIDSLPRGREITSKLNGWLYKTFQL